MIRYALVAACVGLLLASPARAAQLAATFGPATISIEDRVLNTDQDYNDVTFRLMRKCVFDGATFISEEISFTGLAAGAAFDNTLLLQLPGATTNIVMDVAGGSSPTALTPSGGAVDVLVDFRDAFVGSPGGFINTDGGPAVAGINRVIEITYDGGVVYPGTCGAPRFAISRPAPILIDMDTLGIGGEPMVLITGNLWSPPVEFNPIATAFPSFDSWVSSSFVDDTNWSQSPQADQTLEIADWSPYPLDDTSNCGDGILNQGEDEQDCGGPLCAACDYITNGSFDTDLTGWKKGLHTSAGVGTYVWSVVNGRARISATGSSLARFYQVVDVVPGQSYDLHVDAFTVVGADPDYTTVHVWDGDTVLTEAFQTADYYWAQGTPSGEIAFSGYNSGTSIDLRFVPAGNKITISLQMESLGGIGPTIEFDNVALIKTPPLGVRDGAFEPAAGGNLATCQDYLDSPEYQGAGDGVYWVDPVGAGEHKVYCEMDGAHGWMLAFSSQAVGGLADVGTATPSASLESLTPAGSMTAMYRPFGSVNGMRFACDGNQDGSREWQNEIVGNTIYSNYSATGYYDFPAVPPNGWTVAFPNGEYHWWNSDGSAQPDWMIRDDNHTPQWAWGTYDDVPYVASAHYEFCNHVSYRTRAASEAVTTTTTSDAYFYVFIR